MMSGEPQGPDYLAERMLQKKGVKVAPCIIPDLCPSSSHNSTRSRYRMGGPLSAAWRVEGQPQATPIHETKGLKRQLFHQKLRELIVVESLGDDMGGGQVYTGHTTQHTLMTQELAVPSEALLHEFDSSTMGALQRRDIPVQLRAANDAAAAYTMETSHAHQTGQWSVATGGGGEHFAPERINQHIGVRPQSAPGQAQRGSLRGGPPVDMSTVAQRRMPRRYAKIQVPQRGFPLKPGSYN